MPPVRRLTAILAADVAGYSRLMGMDEEGTHERLKAYLRELVNPKIAEHRGRIVKNTGDGFLAEFASVLDAVRCAVEMQRGMTERNAGTAPVRHAWYDENGRMISAHRLDPERRRQPSTRSKGCRTRWLSRTPARCCGSSMAASRAAGWRRLDRVLYGRAPRIVRRRRLS
jgi:hypothetical protein